VVEGGRLSTGQLSTNKVYQSECISNLLVMILCDLCELII